MKKYLFGFLILNSILLFVESGRRRRHQKIEVFINSAVNTFISVGTPPQKRGLIVDTKSAHLILMDVGCGDPRRETRCPTMCRNSRLRPIYCSPMCEEVTAAVHEARCGFNALLDATTSATFSGSNVEISARFKNFRPFYGRRATDNTTFMTPITEKTAKMNIVRRAVKVFEPRLHESADSYVRGFSFDIRYLGGRTGMLGLAPDSIKGHRSFVPNLKASGHIDAAIVSVQRTVPPKFSTFNQIAKTMVLGGLDKHTCHHWKMFPSPSHKGWSFEMADLRFIGKPIAGRNVGRLSLESKFIEIPKAVAEHYLSTGLFTKWDRYRQFIVDAANRSLLNLEFRVGDYSMKMDAGILMDSPYTQISRMIGGDEIRYTDEPQWTFGTGLLDYFCFGYDYEMGAVALGERRTI